MPDGQRAYLGFRAVDRVAVLDLDTLKVTHEVQMDAGAGPACMFWIGASS